MTGPGYRVVAADRLEGVSAELVGYRFSHGSEDDLQAAVAAVLSARWTVEREHRLDDCSRIDIYLPDLRVGVECKIGGAAGDVARQCRRYLEHADVDALLLVTRRARHRLPTELDGKPIAVLSLASAAL